MIEEFKNIWKDMLDMGLGALAHANRHSAYGSMENDQWDKLSILQAAHAAEIIFKAKIAEEHPLLLLEKFPKLKKDTTFSARWIFENGKTIQWSDLPDRLFGCTGERIPNQEILKNSVELETVFNIREYILVKSPFQN